METTISIIVPVYNIIEYLPRCVESLRKQTYDKIEILLVDDGSTDGTAELCDKLVFFLCRGIARIDIGDIALAVRPIESARHDV